jgi:hypothetical protein
VSILGPMRKRTLALAEASNRPVKLNHLDRRLVSGWLRMNQLPFGATLARVLISQGHIDSVLVKSPGSRRGVRLVSQESLDRYLKSLLQQQAGETAGSR